MDTRTKIQTSHSQLINVHQTEQFNMQCYSGQMTWELCYTSTTYDCFEAKNQNCFYLFLYVIHLLLTVCCMHTEHQSDVSGLTVAAGQ